MTACDTCQSEQTGTAYGCPGCARRITALLGEIATLAPAARAVAAGQTRRGPAVHTGGAGSRLPINLAAAQRIGSTQNAITTWARDIAGLSGGQVPTGADPLASAARWLADGDRVERARHRQEWAELYRDVAAAERVLRSVVDGPPPRRWLGQCGAPGEDGPCRLDITARAGATVAQCRCGASVVVADRLAELALLVRGYSYTAAEIAEAYPEIRANTVRVWASRGRILATGEIDGRPTYDLGEVLDRARDELRRRAEREARRGELAVV